MSAHDKPAFLPLTGIHEPSAIQQLADGRFLVLEDERQRPFSLVTIAPDGRVDSAPLRPGWLDGWLDSSDDFWKLDDLEGIAVDNAGNIHAVTSHSRDGDGDEKKSRDKLVRFRIEAGRVVATGIVKGLKPALLAAHPVLATAAAKLDVKREGGLNIEALEFGHDGRTLLIGFRSPLLDGRALIASVENSAAMFDDQAPPRIAPSLITLDLDGDGLRSLSRIPSLGGYLISSGPVAGGEAHFRLWFWSGLPGEPALGVNVVDLPGFERAEGICPAVIGGLRKVIIVSDDGNHAEGRCARFLMLDPDQLIIAR
ncbi:hypothetical protein [Methyloversatilis sp.]|uniref:hypothetical protein n=1 Tax=Methyloversatilis sp. TaxID=2569862 RepID=UPI00273530CC|nr:hypothetical protein [Methyloversatilis sp.]MDP2869438.1 hypothetical protein [Methyloversatilis sp.]MDP3455288.1 hypothetical protein [Methyloversatilis sp.]MDP3578482.1 hypothetical protein [Methyloversatilis sp.]